MATSIASVVHTGSSSAATSQALNPANTTASGAARRSRSSGLGRPWGSAHSA